MLLSEIGERRIISDILEPRYGRRPEQFGDDCAVLKLGLCDELLLVTTDPCPYPMAWTLGFRDFYFYGWLLATINLSDIAAMGGTPVGIVSSLVLPSSTDVDDFRRLLDGFDDACAEGGATVLGGNLKEGDLQCSATAFGKVKERKALYRSGANPGDLVAIVGDIGHFWAAVLAHQSRTTLSHSQDVILKNVLTPRAKVAEGKALAEAEALTSAIDNSDGLYPSLIQLAQLSKCQVIVDFSRVMFPAWVREVAEQVGVEPERFALGWGDWQIIVTLPRDAVDLARDIVQPMGTDLHIIGEVRDGYPDVLIRSQSEEGRLMRLDSQRFTNDSWFTAGIQSYIKSLCTLPLMERGS